MIFISNCEIMSWLINSTNKKGSILNLYGKIIYASNTGYSGYEKSKMNDINMIRDWLPFCC